MVLHVATPCIYLKNVCCSACCWVSPGACGFVDGVRRSSGVLLEAKGGLLCAARVWESSALPDGALRSRKLGCLSGSSRLGKLIRTTRLPHLKNPYPLGRPVISSFMTSGLN